MNRAQILYVVEQAIKDRSYSTNKKYHICWFEKKIQCLPTHHTDEKHTVFRAVFEGELAVGFSNTEWDMLEASIATFLRMEGKI